MNIKNINYCPTTQHAMPTLWQSRRLNLARSISLTIICMLAIVASSGFALADECVDDLESLSVVSDAVVLMQVIKGSAVTLSSPTGSSYVWYHDGVVLAGETTQSLTLTDLDDTDDGIYKAAVDSVISREVELSVLDNGDDAYDGDVAVMNDFNDGLTDNGTLNWSSSLPIEDWDGVTVESCRVTEVNVPNMNLVGTLPSNLNELRRLEEFNIYGNSALTGDLDVTGLLRLRKLTASHTAVSDFELGVHPVMTDLTLGGLSVPTGKTVDLGPLRKLKRLRLNTLNLSTILWANTYNQLTTLIIQNNNLTGEMDLTRMPNLKVVDVSENLFNDIDFSSNTEITSLKIFNNTPDGDRAYNISNLPNLTRFFAYGMKITDLDLGNTVFSKLKDLRVSSNQLTELDTTGLSSVTRLFLHNNSFGEVLDLGNLSNLDVLNISNNNIEGVCLDPGIEGALTYNYANNPCENQQCSTALTCPAP